MAVLVRTNQSIACCHRSDLKVKDGTAAPDQEWVLADGQPSEATRFKVRPLNPDEFHTAQGMESSEARAKYICDTALIAVDGEPAGDLGYGWAQEVANLVVGVTTAPLAGRVRKWTDANSADTSGKK
jgi:hypothetical protein